MGEWIRSQLCLLFFNANARQHGGACCTVQQMMYSHTVMPVGLLGQASRQPTVKC